MDGLPFKETENVIQNEAGSEKKQDLRTPNFFHPNEDKWSVFRNHFESSQFLLIHTEYFYTG